MREWLDCALRNPNNAFPFSVASHAMHAFPCPIAPPFPGTACLSQRHCSLVPWHNLFLMAQSETICCVTGCSRTTTVHTVNRSDNRQSQALRQSEAVHCAAPVVVRQRSPAIFAAGVCHAGVLRQLRPFLWLRFCRIKPPSPKPPTDPPLSCSSLTYSAALQPSVFLAPL